jgi:hypothetical protein
MSCSSDAIMCCHASTRCRCASSVWGATGVLLSANQVPSGRTWTARIGLGSGSQLLLLELLLLPLLLYMAAVCTKL